MGTDKIPGELGAPGGSTPRSSYPWKMVQSPTIFATRTVKFLSSVNVLTEALSFTALCQLHRIGVQRTSDRVVLGGRKQSPQGRAEGKDYSPWCKIYARGPWAGFSN